MCITAATVGFASALSLPVALAADQSIKSLAIAEDYKAVLRALRLRRWHLSGALKA